MPGSPNPAKDRAVVEQFLQKRPEQEIKAVMNLELRQIMENKGFYITSNLLLAGLLRNQEVREFISRKGLDPEALAAKVGVLGEVEKMMEGPGGHGGHLVPRTKRILWAASKRVKEKFKEAHGEESGTVEITPLDVLKGALETDGFLTELAPVWAHLKAGN